MKNKAVTLIELIMAIVIVGVLVGVSSMYVKETIDLWRFLSFRNEIVSQGRIAVIKMGREIRQIRDDLSIYNASATRFRFDDINGNNIDYQLIGNDLMRNADILTTGVQSLKFCYYDKDNNPVCAPACACSVLAGGLPNIYRIAIEVEIRLGTQRKSLKTQIYPRNL